MAGKKDCVWVSEYRGVAVSECASGQPSRARRHSLTPTLPHAFTFPSPPRTLPLPMFSPRRNLVLVLLAAAAVYLVGNGRVSLFDRDEPRFELLAKLRRIGHHASRDRFR